MKPLSNYDILARCKDLPNFMGVFMRDKLPKGLTKGCGVLNLDDCSGSGSHWCSWFKNLYFDSYGFPPPEEFLDKAKSVRYNDLDIQKIYDLPWCGHLCLAFLHHMASGRDFESFAMKVYRV